MEMFRAHNVGLKGLNADLAPWELDSEHITYGNNFRSNGNRLITAGNYLDWSTPGTHFNGGHLMHVGPFESGWWLVLGRSAVYVFDGTTWSDISNVAGYTGIGTDDELLWNTCKLGRIPIANNPQSYPEYWSPQSISQAMQDLDFDATNTWRALGYSCKVMRAHKNYLFALNLIEGVTEYPSVYRWSHPADINGLPFSWDPTDTSSLAGRAQIGGDVGDLVDGLSLRDSFCLYSEKGINILDPSNDEFVWRRRQLSSSVGLLSAECVAQVNNIHFLLADGDILTNDGNNIVSIAHNRIRSRLTANINEDYFQRSYCFNNRLLKEVWFCVPEGDSTAPNMAYIFNWRDNTWSVQDIAANIVRSAYGPKTEVTGSTWATVTGTWDTTTLTWAAQAISPLNESVIGIDNTDTGLVELDPTAGTGAGDSNTRIERINLVIKELDKTKTITRAYPRLGGSSPVSIQVGAQQVPDGAVEWETAITFTPGTDRFIDCRATGFLHTYRIDSIDGGLLDFSGIDFEYVDAGER